MALKRIRIKGIAYFDDRLKSRLPIKTAADKAYIRERFYWIVDKYKDDYFSDGKKIKTDRIFNLIFKKLAEGDGEKLNLSDVEDFKHGFAGCMIIAAGQMGSRLNLPRELFIKQFVEAVNVRFWDMIRIVHEIYVGWLIRVICEVGVSEKSACEYIKASVFNAECYPFFYYPIEELFFQLIYGIIKEAGKDGVQLYHQSFLSPESKSTTDEIVAAIKANAK